MNGGRGRLRATRWMTHPIAAAVLLGVFVALMLGSVRDTSLTFDELAHAAGGKAIVAARDFRLQPENGVLPQALAGMALQSYAFPSADSEAWRNADVWGAGFAWFFESNHDAQRMTFLARAACAELALALGVVVWAWSRRLFGPLGGMISLVLYVLSPTVLANGPLITSDVAAALFFTTSVWTIWELGHRLSFGRVLVCGVSLSALFLSKMSAVLIVPVAAALVPVFIFRGRPLEIGLGSTTRHYAGKAPRVLAFGVAALLVSIVVVLGVWMGYGFRYSAFGSDRVPGTFALPWEYVLEKPSPATLMAEAGLSPEQRARAGQLLFEHGAVEPFWNNSAVAGMNAVRGEVLTSEQRATYDQTLARPSEKLSFRVLEFLRARKLMPEAWIYGNAFVLQLSNARSAFLNGEVNDRGWWWFFPYTFLIKSPLACFVLLGCALIAATLRGDKSGSSSTRWRAARNAAMQTAPLWIFTLVDGAVAIRSHLNIGHRHLLPIYPMLFVFCGMTTRLWEHEWTVSPSRADGRSRWLRGLKSLVAVCFVGLVVEVAWRYPHYLAYFNGIVSPRDAYRHVVDSSLDWGQDLPAVRRFIDRRPTDGPFYFSYFGSASPEAYGISARPLYSYLGLHQRRTPDFAVLRLPADSVETQVNDFLQRRPDYEIVQSGRDGRDVVTALIRKPQALRWEPGTYLVSATMLQMVHGETPDAPRGKWSPADERTYRTLLTTVQPLLADDPAARLDALVRVPSSEWAGMLARFEHYRFARLAAYLRAREPDDLINTTVLVYRLTAADLVHALEDPIP